MISHKRSKRKKREIAFEGLFKRSFALNSVQGLDVERHYTAYSFSEIKLQSKRSNGTT